MSEATVFRQPIAARLGARSVDLSRLAAYVIAGAALGLLAGVAARVAMRAVALLAGMGPGFSVGGTLGILVLGLFSGVGGGLLYAALHRWLSRPWGRFVFGAILTALLIAPLYSIGRGEAPLASPWVIPALFAPIPLLYGMLLPVEASRLHVWMARGGVRHAPLAFVLAAVALSTYALTSMVGMLSGSPRMTPITQHYFGSSAVDFAALTDRLRLWGVLFSVLYLALVAAAIYVGGASAAGRRAALLLPLIPALLLAQSGLGWPFSAVLPESRWVLAAQRAAGLSAVIALFLTYPTMSLGARPTVVTLTAFLAAVFALLIVSPVSGKGWTEWLLWGVLALAFSSALFLQARVLRLTPAEVAARRRDATGIACFAMAALLFLGVFGAALLSPDWGFRNASALAAATGVVIYWPPWLLLPVGVLAALRAGDVRDGRVVGLETRPAASDGR